MIIIGYTIQNATTSEPQERDWSPFRAGRALDWLDASRLCRKLADAEGSQPSWRILDQHGEQVLRQSRGAIPVAA